MCNSWLNSNGGPFYIPVALLEGPSVSPVELLHGERRFKPEPTSCVNVPSPAGELLHTSIPLGSQALQDQDSMTDHKASVPAQTEGMEQDPLQVLGVSDSAPPQVVGVSRCDSAPLLWRDQDLRAVRVRGLVGALLGALPRTPRQNGRLGRPLLLLPEEERLLTELHATANANQVSVPAANQVSVPAANQVSVPAAHQVSVPAANQVSVPAANQVSVPAAHQVCVVLCAGWRGGAAQSAGAPGGAGEELGGAESPRSAGQEVSAAARHDIITHR